MGQEFTYHRCSLDAVVDLYLSKAVTLDDNEVHLIKIVKYLKEQFVGKKNICDVVVFNQGERSVSFDEVSSDHWAWPPHGYRSGAGKGRKNLDPTQDYCGDDRVILGKNFDPFQEPCDEENNYNTTLQIHHFDKVYYEDPKTKTKIYVCDSNDIYAVRIKTQHSKTKIIQT